MTSIQSAAERLRREYAGDDAYDFDGGSQQSMDEAALARAYLAEHDPAPIDETWLRSVGFEDRMGGDLWLGDIVHWRRHSGEVVVQPVQLPVWRGVVRGHPKTRGQLRTLCRALGIPLKEQRDG